MIIAQSRINKPQIKKLKLPRFNSQTCAGCMSKLVHTAPASTSTVPSHLKYQWPGLFIFVVDHKFLLVVSDFLAQCPWYFVLIFLATGANDLTYPILLNYAVILVHALLNLVAYDTQCVHDQVTRRYKFRLRYDRTSRLVITRSASPYSTASLALM